MIVSDYLSLRRTNSLRRIYFENVNNLYMENKTIDLPPVTKVNFWTADQPVRKDSGASCCAPKPSATQCCTPSQSKEENDGACCAQPDDGSACCNSKR
jgi:hypothetical protein